VYGKQELLRDVWGYLSMGNTRTLDAHACRLRKKLSPSSRPWVVNVRGVGYKLTEAV
jgi:DNA-binding response OmpR family regulator